MTYEIIGIDELGEDGLWRGVRLFREFRDVRCFCPRYAVAHGVTLRVWNRSFAVRAERDHEFSLMLDELLANIDARTAEMAYAS
jgi:hypothetical protein